MRSFAVVSALLLLLTACGAQSIDLTHPPAADAATTQLRCSGTADCPSGSYCEKATCADATGTCELFPAECPDDDVPVCGCDRITYFNDCLRKVSGAASAKPGPCRIDEGTMCGGKADTPCPDGTLCARFVGPGPCPMDAMGSCWVVPASCPPKTASKPEWDSCFSFYKCVDTCTAIKTGGPYHHAFMCN